MAWYGDFFTLNGVGKWCAVLLTLGLILGCGRNRPQENEDDHLRVAVTIPPQKWIVERIGADRISCHVLIPAQSDPHTFMGTDSDGTKLARCGVFFTIGLPIENAPWCQAILRSRNIMVVALEEKENHNGEGEGDHEHSYDEAVSGHRHAAAEDVQGHDHGLHTWLSPRRLIQHAEKVAEALSRIDPSNAPLYQENLARTRVELQELDRELSTRLEPLRGETFFVFHPAWECFAEDYGLFQQAVEVQGKDPSDREMTDLQRKARQSKLGVILVQPQFSSQAAKAIAEVAGLQVISVNPLAEDIPGELRRVADVLLSAYRETMGESDPRSRSSGQP
jgi:zinc transport system substrate-binding protein